MTYDKKADAFDEACAQLLDDLNAELSEAKHAACREIGLLKLGYEAKVRAFETALKHVSGFTDRLKEAAKGAA